MINRKRLLTDKDILKILNIKPVQVAEFIEQGMPHYYINEALFFEYNEVEKWLLEAIDLGYSKDNSKRILGPLNRYIEGVMTEKSFRHKLTLLVQDEDPEIRKTAKSLLCATQGDRFSLFSEVLTDICPRLNFSDCLMYYLSILKDLAAKNLFNY